MFSLEAVVEVTTNQHAKTLLIAQHKRLIMVNGSKGVDVAESPEVNAAGLVAFCTYASYVPRGA